jgi:hypothetical protein
MGCFRNVLRSSPRKMEKTTFGYETDKYNILRALSYVTYFPLSFFIKYSNTFLAVVIFLQT